MSEDYETLEFRLATDGLIDLTTLAHTVDNLSTAPEIAMGVLFLAAILIGILATIAALWRSRAVPRGAVVLMFVFVVIDVPLQRPLTAHVIALVAASWIAWSILSAPQRQPVASSIRPSAGAPVRRPGPDAAPRQAARPIRRAAARPGARRRAGASSARPGMPCCCGAPVLRHSRSRRSSRC